MTANNTLIELALEEIIHGIVIYNRDLTVLQINRRAREILAVPTTAFSEGDPFEKLVRINANHGGYGGVGAVEDRVADRIAKARTFLPFKENQAIFDGKFVEVSGQPISEAGYILTYTDISTRINAEKSARASDHMYQQLAATTDEGFWQIDVNGETIDLNPAMCRILGRPKESVLGKTIFDFVDSENREIFRKEIQQRQRGKSGAYEIFLLRPTGENVPCLNNATPIYNDNGEQIGSIGLWKDISVLKETETELRKIQEELEWRVEARTNELHQSEQKLRDFAASSSDWFWEMDSNLRFTYFSKSFENIMKIAPEQRYGKTREDLLGKNFDRNLWNQHRETLEAHKPFRDFTYFQDGKGADLRWLTVSGIPVFDKDGEFTGYRGSTKDVTTLKQTQEQLHHSQKMEAIGQLTGGVAHDFNNLLGVIIGNLDFLEETLGNEPDPQELVATALQAALQAAELTSRLLAFSRQQPLRPVVVDLNARLLDMTNLMQRTLGETITIRTAPSADVNLVEIDPGQLDTALINLAVNARHAMPNGGRLTIETANVEIDQEYADKHAEVETGDYAMLAVSDTGVGMSHDVVAQAFDPFFTTKTVGGGSGLGLSMVYGFVKQSGGHASIYSEEGEGTTVKLYFPESNAKGELARNDQAEPTMLPGAGETVLIVEDDDNLREISLTIISGLGYKAEAVSDGPSALAFLDTGAEIDVLFTDVVLPHGMNGVELASAALQRRPNLRVLYTSGYTENAIVHNGVVDEGINLLNKPYRRGEIAKRLREVLLREN